MVCSHPQAEGDSRGPAKKRWVRRKEARPGEILDAAIQCFAERGFAATRLDDVACRAGVTKGTIYLYFPNKVELFKAVVRESLVPLLDQFLSEPRAGEEDPREGIRRALFATEQVFQSPLRVIPKLVLSEAQNFPDLARFYLDEVVGRARMLVTRAIRQGIERRQFREINPEHVFFSMVGPLILAALWQQSLGLYDTHPLDTPEMLRTHLNIVFRGLSPNSDSGSAMSDSGSAMASPAQAQSDNGNGPGAATAHAPH